MTADHRSRYQAALEAAQAAAQIALKIFEGDFEVHLKSDFSPVTVADQQAEAAIRSALKTHFPQDGFLGEEYGNEPGTSGYRWIIDPIDGTKSFIRRVPLWGTLVGLEYQQELVAGVAVVPTMNLTYHALRGHGAYRDRTRIRVSDVHELSESHMCYSSVSWFESAGMTNQFLGLAKDVSRSRGFGDFYGFCLVAQGSFDFMVDTGVHAWDIAALIPIVEEAGGRMTNWSNRIDLEDPQTLASNGTLHERVLQRLTRS